MKIIDIMKGVDIINCNVDLQSEITGIKTGSKSVVQNDLYIALEGKLDGHNFCSEAIDSGARAAIVEKAPQNLPYIQVADTRKAYALMAENFYGNPQEKLKIIVVTGTNGKTTTTYIIDAILRENGHKTAVIGTLGVKLGDELIETGMTTPDPLELNKYFFDAYKKGVEYVIMEVSAHAIYYKKLEGVRAEIGVFTNITQDHLDFFKNMDEYSKVKMKYFDKKNMKLAIINADDTYGRELLKSKRNFSLSYGIRNPSDVFALDIVEKNGKTNFIMNAFDEIAEIEVPLHGEFNVYNTMAAIAVAKALSVPMNVICSALEKLQEIPGRFNIIKSDITVIIDYAHTPDGLENLLRAAKGLEGGRIITVFGCGGDRDKGKRPLMGKIAAGYSDFCILTSDNPRFEEPMTIIKEIEEGFSSVSQNYICIKERENAIAYAVSFAQRGDKVLIAGKGAEDYIDAMGEKKPYTDRITVESALRRYREC